MMITFLTFFSHMLFIYLSHRLLVEVVDWSKWLKVTAENQINIQLFILFLAVGLGYLVSTFFLDLLSIGRMLSQGLA